MRLSGGAARPILLTLAFVAAWFGAPTQPAAAYDTNMTVPTITGTNGAQRAVGKVFLDAETSKKRVCIIGDSRFTMPGGSGPDMHTSLVFGLASLTSHGNIPETQPVAVSGIYSSPRWPFVGHNRNNVTTTGLATTVARQPANLDPSPVGAAGTFRMPPGPVGTHYIMWGFDPKARYIGTQLRGAGIAHWDTTANLRATVFCCTNPTSSASMTWDMRGSTVVTVTPAGGTSVDTGTFDTTALETSTYGVTGYSTDWVDCDAHEYWLTTYIAGDSDLIETGFCRYESSNATGVATVIYAQGGDQVTSFLSEHPDAGPWYTAMGPYDLLVFACNVNDAYSSSVTPAQHEANLRAAIAGAPTLLGSPGIPCIIWTQVDRVSDPVAEATQISRFAEYAGAAKVVAESTPNTIAINTIPAIAKTYDQNVNWMPGGTRKGTYSAAVAYAVGDVVISTHPYICITATSAGESPSGTPAKWFQQNVAYNAGTTYNRGYCCTFAGAAWTWIAPTGASGVEPGATTSYQWRKMAMYDAHEYVHPNAIGAQLIVDEFVKALRELAGYRRGYRPPSLIPGLMIGGPWFGDAGKPNVPTPN